MVEKTEKIVVVVIEVVVVVAAVVFELLFLHNPVADYAAQTSLPDYTDFTNTSAAFAFLFIIHPFT